MHLVRLTLSKRTRANLETNLVQDGNGGALFYTGSGGLAVISSTFTSNDADSGGALYVSNAASVELTDSDFSYNDAETAGGAAYLNASIAATGCTFTRNNAASESGGALFVRGAATMMVEDCEFSLNSAPEAEGGAVYIMNEDNNAGWVSMAQSQFRSNAAVIGGAVFCGGPVGRIGLEDCRFYLNSGSQVCTQTPTSCAGCSEHCALNPSDF